MKQPLIILTGPTASGKTALSVALAKRIGGEIISADSMQVYRHMDVGSAKVTKEEMDGIPHYLIDVLDPEEAFNVVVFQDMAKKAMKRIRENGHIPIVAGGTGLLYPGPFIRHRFYGKRRRYGIQAQAGGAGREGRAAGSSIRC